MGDGESSPLRLQLLVDWLSGLLGGEAERRDVVGRVARVIVAGGLLQSNTDLSQPTAYSTVRQQAAALEPVRWVRWVGLGGVGRGEQLAAREDRWLHHAPMFCNNFLLSVPPLRSFPALSSHPPQCIPPPLAGMLTWA